MVPTYFNPSFRQYWSLGLALQAPRLLETLHHSQKNYTLVPRSAVGCNKHSNSSYPRMLQEYDWDKLHPFQRRSFRRFPDETEFIPQISSFQPLSSLQNGIQDGKIILVNGTVLSGIDEVCELMNYGVL